MNDYTPVSREDFFDGIYKNNLDVHPHIERNAWPFTTTWKFRNEVVYGRSQVYYPEGSGLEQTRYWLRSKS